MQTILETLHEVMELDTGLAAVTAKLSMAGLGREGHASRKSSDSDRSISSNESYPSTASESTSADSRGSYDVNTPSTPLTPNPLLLEGGLAIRSPSSSKVSRPSVDSCFSSPASSSRRPSMVKRVPVPRLSQAELVELSKVDASSFLQQRNGSTVSLNLPSRPTHQLVPDVLGCQPPTKEELKSLKLATSAVPAPVRRPSSSSGTRQPAPKWPTPSDWQVMSCVDLPSSVQRKASFQALQAVPTTSSVSLTSGGASPLPTPIRELPNFRFPAPPAALDVQPRSQDLERPISLTGFDTEDDERRDSIIELDDLPLTTRTQLPIILTPRHRATTEETDIALFTRGSPSLEQQDILTSLEGLFPPGSVSRGGSVSESTWSSASDSMFDNHRVNGYMSSQTTLELSPSFSRERKGLPTVSENAGLPPTNESMAFSTFGQSTLSFASRAPNSRNRSVLSLMQRRPKKPVEPFSTYAKPSARALESAADGMVYTETGDMVRFGELFEDQRTIVCFIRHYWCPSCQDYMASIMKVTPDQLRALNLKLVIVGCGNWKMIQGYRKLLGGCTFPIVSDPTRALYKQFGMTRSSMSPGKRSAYIRHGNAANVAVSLKRNMAMPLKNPGDLNGLGGEFVVGPGMECSYAHRMRTTRDHAELNDILKAIGVTVPELEPTPKRKPAVISKRPGASSKQGRVVVKVVDNPGLEAAAVQAE